MSTIACVCEFCQEFGDTPKASRILWDGGDFVLLPSRGALTPGYLLLMPKRHVRSFADLPANELASALGIAEHARDAIAQEFGPVIVAEHGPGAPGLRSSACCDHAHWHLIPSNPHDVSRAYERVGGPPSALTEIGGLSQWSCRSYLYLSPLRHVWWVWDQSEGFGSQFVRRVCAQALGIEDFYDWAIFPFEENMLVTKHRLARTLQASLPQSTRGG